MKPMLRKLILAGVAALSLQACVEPSIESANEHGVIVKDANDPTGSSALKLANDYCQKHGRVAKLAGTDALAGHIAFTCVAP
jgi:hypothetical protein